MARRALALGFLALALAFGPAAALGQPATAPELAAMRGERRVALVIGNSAYGPEIGPLGNPANDANDLADVLGRLGFEVTLELDLDRDGMRRAVIDFGRQLRDGGVGLFYFSGHAVQVGGSNYMIPLGAEVASEDYVPIETLEVNEVLARMGGALNRLNIVILDACRNNPFKGIFRGTTRGLAQTLAPSGTFIAYAAAPGQLALDGEGARNSPYTAALLAALDQPGLRLEDVFKQARGTVLTSTNRFQTPWTGSSITGEFFFNLPEPEPTPAPAPPAAPEPAAAPVAAATPGLDMWVWDRIKDSQDPADFETYVATYPDSPLAPYARNRLRLLQGAETTDRSPQPSEPEPAPVAGPEPPADTAALTPAPELAPSPAPEPAAVVDHAAIERALGLTDDDRVLVQRVLTALGHDPREVDGRFGPSTRLAIAAWQQARGEDASGYLSDSQLGAVREEAETQVAVGLYEPPRQYQPGDEFRDCSDCPEMVVMPAGSFTMGSPASEEGRRDSEGPQHRVVIAEPFAVGKYEVTLDEWEACVKGGGCYGYEPDDRGWGRGRRPAINVSWNDAQTYVAWLSKETGQAYRLLSEAEWEYAARAGMMTRYSWGDEITPENANYGRKVDKTTQVGSYPPNRWGLHDMHGNVWEWVEDCWNDSYDGAPTDGSAWTSGECSRRVLRGGSWNNDPENLRSANRNRYDTFNRYGLAGFRVARTLR